ncbi:tight adherence protein RcpC [Citrobacter rodentium]|uniref:Tight adherence protein RcpC n=2 Tax=Citrobacter rodentium TaxID=67825 RepID=D2TIS7_CITRI|nr:tight adherence protein RcpC [Citrobacter rodentium]KIQ50972.1 hypothetical protein TA05_12775 [Citrobacter rodentium]QBY30433.1 hypothetical protein E2R62_17435 [Citrobacter rodentium]UHO32197.1 hypothetical protein K7R23_05725 [Citrobacter rodentium NBRC 105723 = DSM 16636]CBG90837.1 putative tight adherence protein RcpC [Citrobacter rodentium ICC168]HAT8012626.1 hypothetical protein [Citrobacter rodentium NBRC 105723 = DSM 16636]
MRKKSLVVYIYIVMIFVGLAGLFLIMNSPQSAESVTDKAPAPAIKKEEQEKISVAVAERDLPAKAVLTAEDFRIKMVEITRGGHEKASFALGNKSIKDYALNVPVAKGTFIPGSALVKPGTTEYISLFLRPGHVLYTFRLSEADNYLFDNIRAGQFIDIFMVYGKKKENGKEMLVSPSTTIESTRLKPLMKNRRVLALRPTKIVTDKNGISTREGGSQLVAELNEQDIKVLKGLEGKAKIVILPATHKEYQLTGKDNLPDVEAMWPVSEDVIFDDETDALPQKSINQLRG